MTPEQRYFLSLRNGTPTGNESFELSPKLANPFDGFNSDRHPDLIKAVRTIRRWYNERVPVGGSIILAGFEGCGKTHLAEAIHHFHGYRSLYWNEIDLFKSIQGSWDRKTADSEGAILSRCDRAHLLVFDDLGAFETKNETWLINIYYKLFDQRKKQGKPTFITTNLAIGNGDGYSPLAERVGSRLFSRLVGAIEEPQYYVDLFSVPDYRLRNF
jgi:DNA replication protein DnaC